MLCDAAGTRQPSVHAEDHVHQWPRLSTHQKKGKKKQQKTQIYSFYS